MNKVQTLWLHEHVTPTDGYNNNVPFDVHYCYKCNLKIQEDMYGKYSTGHYKYCPKCGTYMVNEVQPIDKEQCYEYRIKKLSVLWSHSKL